MKLFFRYIVFLLIIIPFYSLAQNDKIKAMEKELTEFTGSDSVKFHMLDDLAWTLRRTNPTKALEYAEASNVLAQEIDFRKGEGISYNMMGIIYNILGNYDKALEFFQQALSIRNELGDLKGVGNTLDNIGGVYQRKGEYDKAVANQIEALKLRESIGDQAGMASGYNNIGVIYKNQQDFEKALEYFEKALDIERSRKDSSGIAINYNNIGNVFFLQSDFKKAKEYYEESLQIREDISDQRGIISSYNNLGNVAKQEGNNLEALNYYSKAAKISEDIGDKTNTSISYNRIGELQKTRENIDDAIASFGKSLDIAKEIGSLEIQNANYNQLAEIYEGLAQSESDPTLKASYFNRALNYQKDFFITNDSLFSRETVQQIMEIESKYEIENHAKENEILRIKHQESKTFTQAALVVLLLLCLLLFVSLRSNKLRKKANGMLKLKNEELLSQKEEIASINENLTQANSEIKKKNDDITASINYAKRIQSAMFPDVKILNDTPVTDNFIVLKPRDIVSGDVFWFHKTEDYVFVAAVDCTGHGVPGAIVSMIGFEQLTEIVTVNRETDPAQILKSLQESVREILHQEETQNQDGMDIALCAIDLRTGEIQFAGAKRPMLFISKSEDGVARLDTIKGDKVAIGGLKAQGAFTTHKIKPEKELIFYLFSDGYQDQFGGPENKKFMMRKLKDMLFEIHDKPMDEQRDIVDQTFEDWKGEKDQIDDVLMMGFRLKVPETASHVSV